jgi:hypothetical protein
MANVVPMNIPAAQDPKGNTATGPYTPSNKSPQTSQANAQNVPQGRADTAGASVISGSGSRGKRVMNGKMGKPSFR